MTTKSSIQSRLIPATVVLILICSLYFIPSIHTSINGIKIPNGSIEMPDIDLHASRIFSIGRGNDKPVEHKPVAPETDVHPLSDYALSFDLVMSYYNEDLDRLIDRIKQITTLPVLEEYTRIRVMIYVKNDNDMAEAVTLAIQEAKLSTSKVAEPSVLQLKNRGREGGTFLSHIVRQYDDLATHTMYMQAEMHFHDDAINKIIDYLIPQTGFLNLGIWNTCDCLTCAEPWDATRKFPRLREIYSITTKKFCDKFIPISYLGQFIASKKVTLKQSVEFYAYVRDTLESDMDEFIHKDPRQGDFKDELTNPYFGHTIERAYPAIFGITDIDVTHRCGFGLGGLSFRKPAQDPYNKCQVLDEE